MPPKRSRRFRSRPPKKAKPKVVNKITKEQRAAYRKKLKVILWKPLKTGIAIIRGNFSQDDKKFGVRGRNKQGVANAIIAPIYSTFKRAPKWRSSDLDRILYEGNDLYRKTINLYKLKIGSTFTANCAYPTFYVGYNRVTIFIGNKAVIGELYPKKPDLETAFKKNISDLIPNTAGIIMRLGDIHFAIWGDGKNYFCFCPHDGDRNGRIISNCGTSFALRTRDLGVLQEYFIENHSGQYSLYTMKILNKIRIEKSVSKILLKKPEKEDKEDEEVQIVQHQPKEEPKKKPPVAKEAPPAKKAPEKGKKTVGEKEVLVDELKEPAVPSPGFSPDYKEISADKGILVAKTFVKEPELILHTMIAASIIHSLYRSFLWTHATLSDILNLGKTIFDASDEVAKSENWMERVQYPIDYKDIKYRIDLEKIIYGEVSVSRINKLVLDFKQGVIDFFNRFDVGLVRGPQMVLIWQESGVFYMFDPKERDGMGRKWTRLLSSGLGDHKTAGAACVTWYKNVSDLADTYISTINFKHKQDPYRILKVLVAEDVPKEEDFKAWLALDMEKWKLIGKTSICSKSSDTDKTRPTKGHCIAVAANIMVKVKPVEEWTKETVGEIIKAGIEVYKQTLLQDEDKTKKTDTKSKGKNDDNFAMKDIKNNVFILNNNVRLAFEELVNGKIIGDGTNETDVGLGKGLQTFFGISMNGVLTVRDRHLGIWYIDKFYYMYYPYEKSYGRNDICICKPEDPDLFGYAYALRFKDLPSLTKQLLNMLNVEENIDFSITSVLATIGAKTDEKPPLYKYADLNPKGAILRPFKDNFHEGHEVFSSRGEKQTLANVMAAIGLSQINKAYKWDKEDVEDILRIGDRMYCKHIGKLKECGFTKFTYEWKDVELIIGSNKYKLDKKDVTGPFKQIPPDEEEAEGEEEEEKEQVPSDDLKKILDDWDKEEPAYAMIDCTFYKMSIWKQDKLYFVFDPKASNEQGYPSKRRMKKGSDIIEARIAAETEAEEMADKAAKGEKKEKKDEKAAGDTKKEETKVDKKEKEEEEEEEPNYDDVPNDGAAYVAWFTTLDALLEHLLSKVPSQYQHEDMTFSRVTLTNSMLSSDAAIQNRFNFHQMPDGGAMILRATSSQNDAQFPNRGLQEASNSIIALVFALISIPEKWNSTILDIILKYGDRLYSKSLIWLKETDMKTACFNEILSIQNIVPTFSIYKLKFDQKFRSKVFGGLSLDFKEMKKVITKMGTIEANEGAVTKIKGRLNTLWKSGTAFYLFDPSPTDPNGYVARTGFASLIKFNGINPLFDYIAKKFGCLPGPNVYEISFLEVNKALPSGLPTSGVNTGTVKESPYGKFAPYEKQMKILSGFLKPHKIPVILLCLATLIHSHLHFVEIWTDNVFYQILFLAEYLLGKTSCELDKINDVIKVDLEQIIPNLAIDNVLVHITVQNVFQGPLFPIPEAKNIPLNSALTLYFRDGCSAIITVNNTNFAMWKENNLYYFFEDQNEKEKGNIMSSKSFQDYYLIMIKNVKNNNDPANWYKIQHVKITTIPLKDVCQPKKLSKFESAAMTGEILCLKSSPSVLIKYGEDCHYWDYATNKSKPDKLRIPKKNKEMLRVSSHMEVVAGKTPHEKHKLFQDKIKYQASIRAAIIVAAGMVCIKNPEIWTGKTIDRIIRSGLILYMNTVAAHGKHCIEITNFETIFYLMKARLCVVAHQPMNLCLMEENTFQNFLNNLSKEFKTLYFEAKKENPEEGSLNLLLILEECYFYIFCPCRAGGQSSRLDCSPCLLRFKSISDLVKQIVFMVEGQGYEHLLSLGPITASIK